MNLYRIIKVGGQSLFVAVAIINTFSGIPQSITRDLAAAGKFMIVMAMAAIGLKTDLKKLITGGFRPIFLGLSCWLAVAGTSLLVQGIMKIW